MKTAHGGLVRLAKNNVIHLNFEGAEGVCEVCGIGHYLIHEVTLPYSIPFEIEGRVIISRIRLCTRHFKMMFECSPNRFPKKEKKVAPRPVDDGEPRYYQLRRTMLPTLQIFGRRFADHYSGRLVFPVGDKDHSIELFFALYRETSSYDSRPIYLTGCVKFWDMSFNYVHNIPFTGDDQNSANILKGLHHILRELNSKIYTAFPNQHSALSLTVTSEASTFIRKIIPLQ